MATEQTPPGTTEKSGKDTVEHIRDSAQQIWQAGLGAFAKAQQEGSRVFDALVKEGANVQRKTQQSASNVLSQIEARVTEFTSGLGSQMADKGGHCEELVVRVLEKLKVPSATQFDALCERVTALETRLAQHEAAMTPCSPASPGKHDDRT